MKPKGRTPIPLTSQDLVMVKDYLNSNLSGKECAEKYNVPVSTLRYKVRKFRNSESKVKQN